MNRFTPRGDRLLVKPTESKGRTHGGLYLPSTAKDKENTLGTVAAVGEGCSEVFTIGESVVYASWAGSTVELDGEEHRIVREDEVLGTYHPPVDEAAS